VAPAGRLQLADILSTYGQGYLATHALARSQAKAWRAIVSCRTAALGGHVDRCGACGTTRQVYHSCRNRHCPRCQTRAKEQWIAEHLRELLPVPYTHLVFTLPHALNGLASHHFRTITDLLFASAAATLAGFGANDRWLGGKLAFSLVLHTWSQDLGRHLHVHALVASGALTNEGRWINSRRGFLFPVKALSKVYRAKFLEGLARVRDNANPGKKRTVRLEAGQFIGRFLQHVLPPGFKRIRHYGILASARKPEQLARCRQALQVPAPDPAMIETVEAFFGRVSGRELACCPQCGQPAMRLVEAIAPRRQKPCATGPP
jgi:hypothetical protein